MTKEELLAVGDELLRTRPPNTTIREHTDENFSWLGRVGAFIGQWDPGQHGRLQESLDFLASDTDPEAYHGLRELLLLLYQTRHDLQMQTMGPMSLAIPSGMVFDYFDEIRKIIETARQDVLFVDPYLDAEFVARYLGHVAPGVTVRLLARAKLSSLLPAVEAFAQQSHMKIEVRSAPNFHDRFVFLDKQACYQSGASFKDGAKTSPTTLTQITDAFAVMLQIYEGLWATGTRER